MSNDTVHCATNSDRITNADLQAKIYKVFCSDMSPLTVTNQTRVANLTSDEQTWVAPSVTQIVQWTTIIAPDYTINHQS